MALNSNEMKSKFKQTILTGLRREFTGKWTPSDAEESWTKLANAISDIAADIVQEIVSKAEVIAGIPVDTKGIANSPGLPEKETGATTATGKIK